MLTVGAVVVDVAAVFAVAVDVAVAAAAVAVTRGTGLAVCSRPGRVLAA